MDVKTLPSYVYELLNKIAHENGFTDYSTNVNYCSQPGDGFTSEMFRISISENKSDKRLGLVCKVASISEKHGKDFFVDMTFKNEDRFYNKLMPMFAKFQENKNLSKDDQFLAYPKCYGSIIDDENYRYVIILEDLRPLGFEMWNKAKPSPIQNVRLTMRELGKFHGLSIAFKDQNPDKFAEIKEIRNIFREALQTDRMLGMFVNVLEYSIQLLKNDDHKSIMRHIKSDITRYSEDCFDDRATDHFGVLSHGDCWNNNMLFRFNEEGAAIDIRMLDWQIIRFSSPAIDLVYNLFSSTDKALRDKEYDNLITLYYQSLRDTVKLLGSNPEKLFPLYELKDELKRCGNFALITAPMVMQVSQAESSDVSNMNEMLDNAVESGSEMHLVTGLSDERKLEFGRRLNEMVGDIVDMGYYHKIENFNSI